MISWTGTLACEISESNDMSLVACMVIPELIPVWRVGRPAVPPAAFERHRHSRLGCCLRQAVPVAFRALREVYRSAAQSCDSAAYGKQVIQPGRLAVGHVQRLDDEQPLLRDSQAGLVDSQIAQPLGAGAFEEFQVVGVENHSSSVRVFVVDADLEEGFWGLRIGHDADRGVAYSGREKSVVTIGLERVQLCQHLLKRGLYRNLDRFGFPTACNSTTPSFRPRSPTVTRSGAPISSHSANMTPGRASRSSRMTSTPRASSDS